MRKLLALVALFSGLAHGQCISLAGHPLALNGASCLLPQSQSSLLQLPRLEQSGNPATYITFLGSAKIPNSITFSSALSMSGTTGYMSGQFNDPSGGPAYVDGVAKITLSSLPTTWTNPSFTGTNATITVNVAPTRQMNTYGPNNFTASPVPTTGATSVTLTSLPPGIAVGANWYIKLNGTDHPVKLVTGISGNTLSFGGALTGSGYSATIPVWQWQSPCQWGCNSGDRITGTFVSGGNLYITGGPNYGCSATGWILQAPIGITPTSSWGVANSVTGQSANFSRTYAGPPSTFVGGWQALLGPSFIATGQGMSVNSCYMTPGFLLAGFDPATILTTTNSVAVTQKLSYNYSGIANGTYTSAYPQALAWRSLTTGTNMVIPSTNGPYPLAAGGYYPAVLSSAPSTGATTTTIGLPSSTATVTASVTGAKPQFTVSAVTAGTISNSGIVYSIIGPGMPQGQTSACMTANGGDGSVNPCMTMVPAIDAGPGNPTAAGTYTMSTNAASTQTNQTYTLYPQGYARGFYTLVFNRVGGGTDSRIVHLMPGSGSAPNAQSGSSDPTAFTALGGASYTTATTVAHMGEQFVSAYDGPFGTAFILPGSRSIFFINLHQYGPHGPRADPCHMGASGTNDIPFNPDTLPYIRWQISAYDMADIINGMNVYGPSPYAVWSFPGESGFHVASGTQAGCISAYTQGWMAYDAANQILYAVPQLTKYTTGSAEILYAWSVGTCGVTCSFLLLGVPSWPRRKSRSMGFKSRRVSRHRIQ